MFGVIPVAPIESIPALQLGLGAAIAVLVGVVFLLWGRIIHRVGLMLAGVALGHFLAVPLAARIGVGLPIVRVSLIIAFAAMGLALARLIWALLGAGLAAGITASAILPHYLEGSAPMDFPVFESTETFEQWLAEAGRCVTVILQIEWEYYTVGLVVVGGAAAGLPLIVFLLRPRLGAIFMSALLGAAAIVTGVLGALGRVRPSLWAIAWKHWDIPGVLIVVLLVGGMVFQYRAAIAAERSEEKREGEPPDKDKTKTSDNAEKD